MISDMAFTPALVLDSNDGNARKNFPISLRIFSKNTDRESIFGLRYRAYLEAKLIDSCARQTFSDAYDDMDSTKTIGAFHNDVCIGSLRLAFGRAGSATPTMPCQSVFGDADILTSPSSGRLVEFTRMVVAPDISNNSFRTTLYGSLVRAGMIVCNAGRADMALIAVLPKMMPFYKAMCGFKYIAGPRAYPGVTFDTNLMGGDFRKLDAERDRRNRFFKITADEIDQARRVFAPSEVALQAAE